MKIHIMQTKGIIETSIIGLFVVSIVSCSQLPETTSEKSGFPEWAKEYNNTQLLEAFCRKYLGPKELEVYSRRTNYDQNLAILVYLQKAYKMK